MTLNVSVAALSNPHHIGVVVKDIDETTKFLSSMFGLGPWDISEYVPAKDEVIVGEPFRLKIAFAKLGETSLELLQPVEGDSIWAQALKTHGEGVHHICFGVSNWDEVVTKTQEQGGRMVAGGIVWGTTHWCYFDTNPGGIIVEFIEVS